MDNINHELNRRLDAVGFPIQKITVAKDDEFFLKNGKPILPFESYKVGNVLWKNPSLEEVIAAFGPRFGKIASVTASDLEGRQHKTKLFKAQVCILDLAYPLEMIAETPIEAACELYIQLNKKANEN